MEVTEPTPREQRSHPVHRFAAECHALLDDLESTIGVAALPTRETAEAILELSRVIARVEGWRAAVVAHGDAVDVAAIPVDMDGERLVSVAASTSAWLSAAAVIPFGQARTLVRLAERLDGEFHATGTALREGRVDVEQAQVVVAAVEKLPSMVGPELRRSAEEHLLGLAAQHDAKALTIIGRHLHEVIDPEGAEAELGRRLAAEERAAERRTVLFMRDDGEGVCHGRFRIPSLHGAMLQAALNALASPKRPDPVDRQRRDDCADVGQSREAAEEQTQEAAGLEGTGGSLSSELTMPEVLGQALCEYIERFPAEALPDAGGTDATVVVTMSLEQLQSGLSAAQLDTGQAISAGEARRLACEAGIIPMVLGSDGVVLDAGRRVRLHTVAMRRALRVQHRTCTAEGCTVPSAWCHAHHRDPWARGGATSVRRGTLLCPRHHRLAHHPGYQVQELGHGVTRIIRTHRRRP